MGVRQEGRALKTAVKQHWETEPCNTRYASGVDRFEYFAGLERVRYELEPYILELADFRSARGKKVLEIGVGIGIDFANWVRAGAHAVGIDLTERNVSLTREWLTLLGHPPGQLQLQVADAENLPFGDGSFEVVYSYGVLHHTPDTPRAFREAYRVLARGGQLGCMIYHVPSWTAINLWLYHALLKLRPWKSLRDVVFENVESAGTKVYTVREARSLLAQIGFKQVRVKLFVDSGDLLTLKISTKYEHDRLVRWAVKLYPRSLIKRLGSRLGTTMCISAVK